MLRINAVLSSKFTEDRRTLDRDLCHLFPVTCSLLTAPCTAYPCIDGRDPPDRWMNQVQSPPDILLARLPVWPADQKPLRRQPKPVGTVHGWCWCRCRLPHRPGWPQDNGFARAGPHQAQIGPAPCEDRGISRPYWHRSEPGKLQRLQDLCRHPLPDWPAPEQTGSSGDAPAPATARP